MAYFGVIFFANMGVGVVKIVFICEAMYPTGKTGDWGDRTKFDMSGMEKTNTHKQILGVVPGMGRGQICLCVALLLGEKGNK